MQYSSVQILCAPRISADRDSPDIAQPAKKKWSGWHWQLLALAKRVLKPQDKNLLGKKRNVFHSIGRVKIFLVDFKERSEQKRG